MRRRRSESVQFVTLSEMRVALGTMTSAPSHVRTVQDRMPICCIRPEMSPIWTASPTSIRRSNRTTIPETKLLTTFCSPNPMPTPNAPARMVTLVRSTPSAASASRKPARSSA